MSLSFLGMYVGGYALWLGYGLAIVSLPLVVADVAGVLAGTFTLALALRLRWRPASSGSRRRAAPDQGEPRSGQHTRARDEGG